MKRSLEKLLLASALTLSALACTTVPETQNDTKEAVERTVGEPKNPERPQVETVICSKPLDKKETPTIEIAFPEGQLGKHECLGIDTTPKTQKPEAVEPFKDGQGILVQTSFIAPFEAEEASGPITETLIRDLDGWTIITTNGKELQKDRKLKEQVIVVNLSVVDISIDRTTLTPEVKLKEVTAHSFEAHLGTNSVSFAALPDGTIIVYPGNANNDNIQIPKPEKPESTKKRRLKLKTFKHEQGISLTTNFNNGKQAISLSGHPDLYKIIEDFGGEVLTSDHNEMPYHQKMLLTLGYLHKKLENEGKGGSNKISMTITGHEPERIFLSDPNAKGLEVVLELGGMGLEKAEYQKVMESISENLFNQMFIKLKNGNYLLQNGIAIDQSIAYQVLLQDPRLEEIYLRYLDSLNGKASKYSDQVEYFWEVIYGPINQKLALQNHYNGTNIASTYGAASIDFNGEAVVDTDWTNLTLACPDDNTTTTLSKYLIDLTDLTNTSTNSFNAVTLVRPDKTTAFCQDGMVILTQ